MIVSLPFPDPKLFPNRKNGKHWTTTNAAKVAAREGAEKATLAARGAFIPKGGTLPLSIVFVAPDGRHRDLDNCLAAGKSAIDGIADALGVNDRCFRPILVDYIRGDKPGAMIVAIGVRIETMQVITE